MIALISIDPGKTQHSVTVNTAIDIKTRLRLAIRMAQWQRIEKKYHIEPVCAIQILSDDRIPLIVTAIAQR
jgi:hypothetical protein